MPGHDGRDTSQPSGASQHKIVSKTEPARPLQVQGINASGIRWKSKKLNSSRFRKISHTHSELKLVSVCFFNYMPMDHTKLLGSPEETKNKSQ